MTIATLQEANNLFTESKFKEALPLLENARKEATLEPEQRLPTLLQLAKCYVHLENFSKACAVLNEVRKLEANHVEANVLRASVYTVQRKYAKARKVLEKMLPVENSHVYMQLALCCFEMKDFHKAIEYAKRERELEPNTAIEAGNVFIVAKSLNELNEPELALKELELVSRDVPDNIWYSCLNVKAQALSLQKKFEEALVLVNEILADGKSMNDIAIVQSEQVQLLMVLNKFPEALESSGKLIKMAPNAAAAYVFRAKSLQAMDRHTESVVDCQRAMQLGSKEAEALLGIAYCSTRAKMQEGLRLLGNNCQLHAFYYKQYQTALQQVKKNAKRINWNEEAENFVIYQCLACAKFGLAMSKCTACKAAQYCNAECQKQHWMEHKKTCQK